MFDILSTPCTVPTTNSKKPKMLHREIIINFDEHILEANKTVTEDASIPVDKKRIKHSAQTKHRWQEFSQEIDEYLNETMKQKQMTDWKT